MTSHLVSPWQPIETAPTDGTWFVSANFDAEEPEYEVHQYAPYDWRTYEPVPGEKGLFREKLTTVSEFSGSNIHRATHWMPLPPTPEVSHVG